MANLKFGSTGDEVKQLQQALGFTGKDVDGIFGQKTEKAVRDYQAANNLTVDGIAGKNTLGSLYGTSGSTSTNTSTGTASTGSTSSGTNATGTAKNTFTTPAGNTYDSFTYDEFTYDPFQGSDTLNQAWDTLGQLQGNAPGAWTDPYKDKYMGYLNQYENRDPFSYDFNSDALYQQYKDQYIQQGQMAMMDAMGQAAAMTGGYGNSYAQTVGQQVYNQYLGQLNEIMPELYDRAYGIYQQEGQELLDMYNAYLGLSQNDYNQYLGDVDRYYMELDAATNYANNLYNKEYGEWSDKTQMDFDTWSANTGLSYDEWAAKTGIISDENNTLMNQKFTAEENQKDRDATAKANAKSDLINLITATGYEPTESELEAAGMSREQANSYKDAYTASLTSTGGDGGTETTYSELEVGSTAYNIIQKAINGATDLDDLALITSEYIRIYGEDAIKGMYAFQKKLEELTPKGGGITGGGGSSYGGSRSAYAVSLTE